MKSRGATVALLGALMAAGILLAVLGRRGAARPGPAPKPPEVSAPPFRGGVVEPKEPPPDTPLHPPPVETDAGPGWRFGENCEALFDKGPSTLRVTCGQCHAVPPPTVLPAADWVRIVEDMKRIAWTSNRRLDNAACEDILKWYVKNAPSMFEPHPPATERGALRFNKTELAPGHGDPKVANVNVADLDGDGKPEVIVCDCSANAVMALRRKEGGWEEQVLAVCTAPGHTAVMDADGDGDLDVVVAGLGSLMPTDDATGYVALLVNDGAKGWTRRDLLEQQPRIADVEPADVDGDGDVDFLVGAFGWRKTGYIGWLRNDRGTYELVKIADNRPGAIHVPVADLDGDGKPDFVALVAQEAETVTAFMNKGGTFEATTLFEARNPLYGCSGLQLVDLDRDGDLDCLFTNGDSLDDPLGAQKPYHGVQWLENKGKLAFEWHDIGRCYGPYRAVAADLDGDGDLDVAVAVLFGKWTDPKACGLLWYENDGKMGFARHDVTASPPQLITLVAADLDGDGKVELVTGRMTITGAKSRGDALLDWKVGK